MVDEFGNKDSIELALDQAVGEATSFNEQQPIQSSLKSSMLLETPSQIAVWACEPTSPYPIIKKDLPMANLDEKEKESATTFLMFSNQWEEIGDTESADFFEFMADLICGASLGKGGFGQKQINKQTREVEFKGQLPAGTTQKKGGFKIPDFRKYL